MPFTSGYRNRSPTDFAGRNPYLRAREGFDSSGIRRFQERQPVPYGAGGEGFGPFRGIPAGEGNIPGQTQRDKPQVERQRQLLGPLGGLLPEGQLLQNRDVAQFEAGLNAQQIAQEDADRRAALAQLQGTRVGVGTSPESVLVKEIATQRLQTGGPYSADELDAQRSNIRQRGAAASQEQGRVLSEQFGARGLGGGVPALSLAALEQQLGLDVSGQLTDFSLEAARAKDDYERYSLSQLADVNNQEELQRIALDNLIQEAYLAPRTLFDLSALNVGQGKRGKNPVGGGRQQQGSRGRNQGGGF